MTGKVCTCDRNRRIRIKVGIGLPDKACVVAAFQGAVAKWLRQRIANPPSLVRIRAAPLLLSPPAPRRLALPSARAWDLTQRALRPDRDRSPSPPIARFRVLCAAPGAEPVNQSQANQGRQAIDTDESGQGHLIRRQNADQSPLNRRHRESWNSCFGVPDQEAGQGDQHAMLLPVHSLVYDELNA